MTRKRKNLAKQTEKVSKRNSIMFRAEKGIFKNISKISRETGLSLNGVLNNLLKGEMKLAKEV